MSGYYLLYKTQPSSEDQFNFTKSVNSDEMQHITLHFIWVFTVYKSTRLGVSQIQNVDSIGAGKKSEEKSKYTF